MKIEKLIERLEEILEEDKKGRNLGVDVFTMADQGFEFQTPVIVKVQYQPDKPRRIIIA
jgi:hypothetical protein